ncbi:LppX_LprAFG lipoprotein [Streptomyces sp. NBC_01314]|uniref:LppX_LprAFG lipoprotein n=1 Tax=Streptomyces sp. NBC_01314 TaxID=2903821 RepID=UPI00352C32DD
MSVSVGCRSPVPFSRSGTARRSSPVRRTGRPGVRSMVQLMHDGPGSPSSATQSPGSTPCRTPTAQSTLLTGSKDLRLIGTETVDGARTTHYKGTVNSDGLIRERLDQFMQLEVSDPLTMDLWIDGDDRTKQFRMRAEHNDMLVGTGDGLLDLTITFLDINKPVAIKAPPTKDTTPLADDAQAG